VSFRNHHQKFGGVVSKAFHEYPKMFLNILNLKRK